MYWMIVFLMSATPDQEFQGKVAIPFKNAEACSIAKKKLEFDGDLRFQFVCVSDDHYKGRKQDPGMPLD